MNRAVVLAATALATGACKEKAAQPVAPTPPREISRGPTAVQAGSGATAAADAVATGAIPAGTDQLVAVPADVARGVTLRVIATGLKRPVAAVARPGDPQKRLYIVEQHKARIRVLEGGELRATAFFELGTANISNGSEQGLLGLAFHPAYDQNRKLYVSYTGPDDATHVVEYRTAAGEPDAVDPATAREVFTHDQPYSNHNAASVDGSPAGTTELATCGP